MRLLVDSLNFSWHCAMMCEDPENFHSFAKAFFLMSMKYWQVANYTDIVYTMDKGSFRYDIYPQYKAKRKEDRDKAIERGAARPTFKREHLFLIGELLNSINIPFIYRENYEADDIICSLVRNPINKKGKQVILSTDGDYEQLIDNELIYILKFKNGWTSIKEVKAKYNGRCGLEILDIKAMIGDKSDNITGIKGVALKTALKLLDEHKSLESIDKFITENQEHKLVNAWDMNILKLNRQCMQMVANLELPYDPCTFQVREDAVEKFAKYDLDFILRKIQDYYRMKRMRTML